MRLWFFLYGFSGYLAGKPIPDVGAEANRQAVERLLVKEKRLGKKPDRPLL